MAPTGPPQEVFASSRGWHFHPAVVLTLAAALSCGGDETIPPDPPEPTRVTVSPSSLEFAAMGDTARLSAQVHDQYDDLMADAAVTWASSDASVASVDSEGLVRSVGNGEAVVTATAGSAADSATVTVAQVVSSVGVSPAALEFSALGDTLRLAAEPADANGHPVEGATVTWMSGDAAVVVVDTSGLVRSVGNGEAAVTVTAGSVSGTATATVEQVARVVVVTPVEAELSPDDTVRLAAEAEDANGFAIADAMLMWSSSDTAVAVVDSTGLVRAVSHGVATITATVDSVSGSTGVIVAPRVRTVLVRPSEAVVPVKETIRLSATAWDVHGRVVEDAEIEWASGDESVATVGESGLVRGLTEGRAAITATSEVTSGSAVVTVVEPSERGALLALFRSTGGAGWVNKTNWLTDAPLRDWYGVTTDGAGRVIGLELESNNLVGSIPPEIEHLSELRRLVANTNTLTGKIPPEIGNLTRLERLMLRSNALSGPIPRQIGRLATMTTMGLDHNKLSGQIPAELGNLTRLAWLDLSTNDLAGEVPPELATTSLAALFVGGNLLRGPVPGSFLDSGIETFRAFQPTYRNLYLCVPGTTAFVAWAGKRAPNGRFCNASDQVALESLYQATDGEDWTDSDGWLSGPALGEWSGVETDSLGRVTALDLAGNELSGELPVPLGHLAAMTELKLGDNSLMGPLPLSLMSLSLRELRYADTELCTPDDAAFRAWLKTIDVHEGTGVECAALTDRDILTHLYHATAGAHWRNSDNWLSDSPLEDWHGVGVDDDGRVTSLNLHYNNLTGVIPPELGRLARLDELRLTSNPLTGPIPPELGDLANLRSLHLFFTQLTGEIPAELGRLSALEELWLQRMPLTGSIPPELGELSKLRFLALADCNLRGPIPPELGRLSNLERLYLLSNRLTGTIPPELGDLSRLILLNLSNNRLTGSIPDELGNLARLERVYLHNNGLTGRVPPNLGDLSSVDVLNLINNDLSGPLPATFGRLSKLEYFQVSNNAKMSGVLPGSLESLGPMELFLAGGTALCAPNSAGFREWLATVRHWRIRSCPTSDRSHAYLTQAVQSLQYPVPLVAGEPALLRVFVTVPKATDAKIPPVRATFYRNGSEVYVIDIAGGSEAIPVEVEEGELSKSANAEVPARLVRPGLEVVIEIDPDSTLDADLGLQRRIPRTGRKTVDVTEMPTMHLTVLPFLWEEEPDSSILDITDGMTAQDTLLLDTRTLLPVGDFEVEVHDPVWTSTNNIYEILPEVEAIRVMEGNPGHYVGTMTNVVGAAGLAYAPGFSSFSWPGSITIAHELGHNISLHHAPCGGAGAPDPSFPSPTGSIGVWGYDFRDGGSLVPASRKDLMSYCSPHWISDYSFTKGLFYRLSQDSASASPSASLLLWGGLDENDDPFLEPAFVVDAPPTLPTAPGAYALSGRTAGGDELFTLSFDMQEVSDGGTPSFVFALPARAGWADRLASITLSGPAGVVSLDARSEQPMTILRDSRTGRVRGILRDRSPEEVARISATLGRGLEVLFSRGVPDAVAWH